MEHSEFAILLETKFPKMYSGRYGGIACQKGWYPIIQALSANIQNHIDWSKDRRTRLVRASLPDLPDNLPEEIEQVVVEQVKEKLGGLRFYYTGGDDYIHGLVRMAESWSYNTCEECGKPGKSRSGSWIRTLCDEHTKDGSRTLEF